MFVSVLKKPDSVYGTTEKTAYRFEEKKNFCNVNFDYKVENGCAKVIIYPSGEPVKYIKFRFRSDFSLVDKVYGDYWGRSSYLVPLEWKNVMPERVMPWYCYLLQGDKMHCYGVKTGADCFASWFVDAKGITLFLDLSNGSGGTDLKEPLLACEVVELEGQVGEPTYNVAQRFCKIMCDSPKMPLEPIFGVNNWYWAYGNISKETALKETDYLMEMTKGVKHRPYMIIDDGWQKHHRIKSDLNYNGGEWLPNRKFGDMKDLVDKINDKGAKAGLWFRPLLTKEDLPDEQILTEGNGGKILDPSHPENLKKIQADTERIRSWGFELIKHDFSQIDMFGAMRDNPEINDDLKQFSKKRVFYDKTKTNATIIKNLYKAIEKGAGGADVIGCNVFGHLSAGIHSIQRIGNDTSGQTFEITRSDGINSALRLPQNKNFYLADPDCAAFTDMVDAELNLDFLEMCAITGMTALASVTPGILTDGEMKRINAIFKLADQNTGDYGIKNYEKNNCPDSFINPEGKEINYDWYRCYDGVRVKFDWTETNE